MAPRVTRPIAQTLVPYIKSLTFAADFFDKNSKSAFEFYRQMSSRKTKKINPNLECILSDVDITELKSGPFMKVEYLDGTKFEIATGNKSAADLRYEVFSVAADVEDNVDDVAEDAGAKKSDKGGKGKK